MSLKVCALLLVLCVAMAHAHKHHPHGDRKQQIKAFLEKEMKHLVGGEPHTITALNVSQYLGTWYQMYTDAFNGFIEPNPYCAQAIYGLNPNGTVSVTNRDRKGSFQGPIDEVKGYAYQPNPHQYPGRLVVRFPFTPVNGPYWILFIGPVVGDQYQWAVVSDYDKISLFILARDPAQFQSTYQQDVLAKVKAAGFTGFLNSPQAIPQGPQCKF